MECCGVLGPSQACIMISTRVDDDDATMMMPVDGFGVGETASALAHDSHPC